MVDNTILSRLRPRWDTLVNSMRQNLGTSVVRNAMSVPSDEQLERAKILNIRKSNADRKLTQAREALAANPGDMAALEALKAAKRERSDVFADEGIERVGQVAGDYIGDGTRNLWWLINAPQAITGLVGRSIMKSEGTGALGAALGGTGLTLGMELATGNIDLTNLDEAGRPKGYSALFPKEIQQINPETGELEVVLDRTKSNNPAAEIAARYFLNRTGRILPEEQFLAERPDVTPEEYARFRAAKQDNTFFGLEDMPVQTSAPLGAISGAVASNATGRNRIAGALLGGITAPLAKEVAIDVPTSLGILHGTTETPDDPVGEIEFLGYRIPFKAIAATAALGAGMKVGARALRNRSMTNVPKQLGLDLAQTGRFTEEAVGPARGAIPRSHVKVFEDSNDLVRWLDSVPDTNYKVDEVQGKFYVYKDQTPARIRRQRINEEF
jgi:hypothetical protein